MPLWFRLDDATSVQVADGDVEEVYDQLWLLVPRPGAVTAAAKIRHAQLGFGDERSPLSAAESAALLAALDHVRH